MSTIYLLRHAEAESSSGPDADRNLTAGGERDARRLGHVLRRAGERPALCLASTARRAQRTAELVLEAGSRDVERRSNHALYQAQPADVLAELRTVDESVSSVLLVGHEPAWSTVASHLVGAANLSLSPGTCIRIDCSASWSAIDFGAGILRWMVPPALLSGLVPK